MAENGVGLLERMQMLNRLEQVTQGSDGGKKAETTPVAEATDGTETKTKFQTTLRAMKERADKIIAEERRQAEIAARQQAEQAASIRDTQEYDNVLAMINRQLAAGGRRDAVEPTNTDDRDGVTVSPANRAFLEGRGQGR